jgi:glycosyltransferase involved in cell wall biosynthesis
MKILMLVDGIGPTTGGGERMAAGLASTLATRGHEIVLCVTRVSSPEHRKPLERAGVRVLSLERRGRLRFWAFRPLVKLLRGEEIQVIHSHKFGSNVWGVLLGRLCRVPVVVAHEQTWSYEGQIHRVLLDTLIGRLCSAFIAVSSMDRDRMISREHVPAAKIRVIPNAYIPRSDSGGGDLRGELAIPAGTPIVGTVAVLRPQKALHVLLEAFAKLDGPDPQPRLVIAGGGEAATAEELRDRSRELGIDDRVSFLGRRQDIGTLLEAFDVAAMSSDFEGTPLFALECMSAGKALVATDVGGLPELVEDGRSGLLVPRRDSDRLAAAIGSLLADPELRQRVGDNARERAREFTIDRIADRFTALYESLLAQARS